MSAFVCCPVIAKNAFPGCPQWAGTGTLRFKSNKSKTNRVGMIAKKHQKCRFLNVPDLVLNTVPGKSPR